MFEQSIMPFFGAFGWISRCPPVEPLPHWVIVDRFAPEGIDAENPEVAKFVRDRMAEETPKFVEHMHKLTAEFDSKR